MSLKLEISNNNNATGATDSSSSSITATSSTSDAASRKKWAVVQTTTFYLNGFPLKVIHSRYPSVPSLKITRHTLTTPSSPTITNVATANIQKAHSVDALLGSIPGAHTLNTPPLTTASPTITGITISLSTSGSKNAPSNNNSSQQEQINDELSQINPFAIHIVGMKVQPNMFPNGKIGNQGDETTWTQEEHALDVQNLLAQCNKVLETLPDSEPVLLDDETRLDEKQSSSPLVSEESFNNLTAAMAKLSVRDIKSIQKKLQEESQDQVCHKTADGKCKMVKRSCKHFFTKSFAKIGKNKIKIQATN